MIDILFENNTYYVMIEVYKRKKKCLSRCNLYPINVSSLFENPEYAIDLVDCREVNKIRWYAKTCNVVENSNYYDPSSSFKQLLYSNGRVYDIF